MSSEARITIRRALPRCILHVRLRHRRAAGGGRRRLEDVERVPRVPARASCDQLPKLGGELDPERPFAARDYAVELLHRQRLELEELHAAE
jgi:hypothetical protein